MATAFTSAGVYSCDGCHMTPPFGEVLVETNATRQTYCPACAPTHVPAGVYAEALRRYHAAQASKANRHVGCDIF